MFATASLHYFGGGLMLDYCYFDQRPSLLSSSSGFFLFVWIFWAFLSVRIFSLLSRFSLPFTGRIFLSGFYSPSIGRIFLSD
mmetsp:Transcript_9244/g.8997  ORF Transcript_9244/g.8997 Transcript_9244/m.8997 type:complete len:82 (+) Transcript_9244:234-479(+)